MSLSKVEINQMLMELGYTSEQSVRVLASLDLSFVNNLMSMSREEAKLYLKKTVDMRGGVSNPIIEGLKESATNYNKKADEWFAKATDHRNLWIEYSKMLANNAISPRDEAKFTSAADLEFALYLYNMENVQSYKKKRNNAEFNAQIAENNYWGLA